MPGFFLRLEWFSIQAFFVLFTSRIASSVRAAQKKTLSSNLPSGGIIKAFCFDRVFLLSIYDVFEVFQERLRNFFYGQGEKYIFKQKDSTLVNPSGGIIRI